MIADLKERFDIDVRDLFSDDAPLSPRWVLAHARTLPIGSGFMAEQRGGQEYRGWDLDRYALTAIVNAANMSNYLFLMANRDPEKPFKVDPPVPWDYPGTESKRKEIVEPGSFKHQLANMVHQVRKNREARKWQEQVAPEA